MYQKQISIIIPIYNIEKYLPKCIDSVIAQTYKNIEIILVDDGSTDSSGTICDCYAEKDSRIKVIHKENGGLVSARKAGTLLAGGEYIYNVDGDDYIEPNRIRNLVNSAIRNDADMIYMDGHINDYGSYEKEIMSHVIEQTITDKNKIISEVVLGIMNCNCCFKNDYYPAVWKWGIKKDLAKSMQMQVDDRIVRAEDLIYIVSALLETKSVTIIKESGYHYRQRNDSIIGSRQKLNSYFYNKLKRVVMSHKNGNSKLDRFAEFVTIANILSTDYFELLAYNAEFLYPYSIVVPNKKIIVYGAGNVGQQLVEYIISSHQYELVQWVDSNQVIQNEKIAGIEIGDPSNIRLMDDVFVVIAIYNYDVSVGIKRKLLNSGFKEEQIALMDSNVISSRYIPSQYLA